MIDLMLVELIYVIKDRALEFYGLFHHSVHKSVEPGTVETMQSQEHKQSLDAPHGLCPQYHNSRTQDTAVEPYGIHSAPLSTGVVQSALLLPLAACTLVLVTCPTDLRIARAVFVPSGV